MLKINQTDGFDCPGCAWPEPHDRSRFEFCENGAKAVAEEATDRRIDAAFFAHHPVSELATHSEWWLGQQGRLTEPVIRRAGDDHYRPISWDDAFRLIGSELRSLPSPDRAVFYTSGRTSNEAAFAYQLLARALGTNNLPDCSNMCHESSGAALGRAIGVGKGTVSLDDVHAAELILVIGQNPGTNHPRMLTALEEAKGRGATIVAINPMREAGLLGFRNPQRARGIVGRGTELSDLHLPIRVGADLALFQLVNRRLVDDPEGGVDTEFVSSSCDGYDDLVAHLRSLDTDALLAATGLDADAVERLHQLLRGAASDHRLLGDGSHPAPPSGGDDPGAHEHAPAPRCDRQTGCRRVPGARAQQRAGRPHDGHLREAVGGVPRRAGRTSSASPRHASTATTPSQRSRRCAAVTSTCSSGWAATSSRRRPTAR